MIIIEERQRCPWATKSLRLLKYHDREWGVPRYDEQELFAALSLEIFQAGLQWELILKKRPATYRAFDNFKYSRISTYSGLKLQQLLTDSSIIRNRAKIRAVIHNAKILMKLNRKGITLKQLTWDPVNQVPLDHLVNDSSSKFDNSEFIQSFLIRFRYYGFKRVGPKTLYSYLQAVGVVNDHLISCFRHDQINRL